MSKINFMRALGTFAFASTLTGALACGSVAAQTIDEIIVTSQKKAVGISVQDVGVAITALDANKIDDSFSVDLRDLARFAPNAELDSPASFIAYPNFYIRGIGVNGSTRTADPSVGIFLNGVYLGFAPGSLLDTFDMEVVEILRGPQGTLFGRNVTGGAINARTKRPGDEYKVSGKITVGDYDQFDIMVAADIPLSENAQFRLAVLSQQRDGYWEDNNAGTLVATDGRPDAVYPLTAEEDIGGIANSTGTKPEVDSQTVRATLVTQLGDNTDLTLIGEWHTSQNGTSNSKNIAHRNADGELDKAAQTTYGYVPIPGYFNIDHNLQGESDVELWSLTGELNHDLGHGVVTAIAGHRELVNYDHSTDLDGTPFTLFHFPDNKEDQEQDSLEIRYASTFSDKFDFTTGVYFFDQSYFVGELRHLLGAIRQTSSTNLDHEISAIFGQLTYNLSDQISVVGGLRYTEEEKQILFTPPNGASDPTSCDLDFTNCTNIINESATFENTTPHLALNYRPDEDKLFYVSYTEGFKSGAFNQRAQEARFIGPAAEESVTSYEVGMKSILRDGRLLFNAAAFLVDYEDIQVNVNETLTLTLPDGSTEETSAQALKNAAKAEVSGFEIEARAYLTDAFQVNAAIGYVDAEYETFEGLANPGSVKFARVPDYTYNLGFTYDRPVATGVVTFRGDYSYKDDYYADVNNDPEMLQEGFGLLDASVTYENEDKGYSVSLYGRNITDEEYHEWGAHLGGIATVLWGGAPQRFGVVVEFGL